MTRLLVAAILLCQPAASLRAQTAVPIARFTAGGVTVIHKAITANDVIAVRVYLKGGSAALTPATAGIEKLIGELAVHGTSTYPKETFAALTTQTGTNIGAEVDRDYTVFTLQAVRQNWEQAWDLFQQAVLHPAYPEEEVDNVRRQILDRLGQRRDTPDEHLELVGDSLLYAGHPYAVDPLGTAQSIESITRDQLIEWHLRRFTKANLLIVAAGNVGREDLAARVAKAFGMLPETGGEAPALPALPPAAPELVTIREDLPTNYIIALYAAPAPASPDYPALRIATRVLGERLFEEVRTRRNLTYAVTAGMENQAANNGDLYVTAVEPDTTLKVILAEVRRLKEEPVSAARLGESVNVYVTNYLMSQQTNMGQAAELGGWELVGGGWENGQAYLQRLRAVTPAAMQRAARTYMKDARFVVLGDPAKVDRKLFLTL